MDFLVGAENGVPLMHGRGRPVNADRHLAWVSYGMSFAAIFAVVYVIFLNNLWPRYQAHERSQFYLDELFLTGLSLWNELEAFGFPEPIQPNIIFHPSVLLSHLLFGTVDIPFVTALSAAVGILVFHLLCRTLGMARWLALLCAATFTLSEVSVRYLLSGWETATPQTLYWLVVPIYFYPLVKFLGAPDRHGQALWITIFALVFGIAWLSGHPGQTWALAWGVAAFIVASIVQDRRRFWFFAYAAVLIFLMALWKNAYLIEHRAAYPFDTPRASYQSMTFGYYLDMFWGLFARPIFPPLAGDPLAVLLSGDVLGALDLVISEYYDLNKPRRWLFFGPPFTWLAVYAVFRRSRPHPLHRALAAAFVLTLFYLCLPPEAGFKVLALPQLLSEPVTFFGILLAGVTLQRIKDSGTPGAARTVKTVAAGQCVFVAVAMAPHMIEFVIHRPADELAHVVPGALEKKIRALTGPGPLRLYYSPKAFRTIDFMHKNLDHRMAFVTTIVMAVSQAKFFPIQQYMYGSIYGQRDTIANRALLDVLGITTILAAQGEAVDPTLVPLGQYVWGDGTPLRILRNEDAWPGVALVDRKMRRTVLPRRPGCAHDRLMCADFSAVAGAIQRDAVRSYAWNGDELTIVLRPGGKPSTVFVSQSYWPGWRATVDGRSAQTFPLLEAFIGVDVPAGAGEVRLVYRPPLTVVAVWLSFGTMALALLIVLVLTIDRRSVNK